MKIFWLEEKKQILKKKEKLNILKIEATQVLAAPVRKLLKNINEIFF